MKTIQDYILKVMAQFHALGEVQTNAVFLLALRDYFDHRIDVHLVSSIATQLYYTYNIGPLK